MNALLGGVLHAAVDPRSGDLYYVYGNRDVGGNNRLAIRRVFDNGAGGVTVGPEHFVVSGTVTAALPSVAVTQHGAIGVFYYTYNGIVTGFPQFTAWLATSTDQGATFTNQSLKTFLSPATDNGDGRQRVFGDYMQTKAVGDCFLGAFTANGAAFGRSTANNDPIFYKACVPVTALNAPHDFNGDSKSDILWHNGNGSAAMWLMNGTTPVTQNVIGTVDTAWQIAGTSSLVQSTGDFDGDGNADLLWRKSDGTVAMWLMNGTTPTTQAVIGTIDTAWQIAGSGDFDGDGKADILWRKSDGTLAMWLMNGTTPTTQVSLGTVDTAWQIVGIGDFNGDGKADILWRKSDGTLAMWLMNGTTPTTQTVLGTVDTAWQAVGVSDFDGDGKADILWHKSDGSLAMWLMNGTTPTTQAVVGTVDTAWQVVSTGDYDGDGKGDILWRKTDGGVAMWLMNGITPTTQTVVGTVDTAWSVVE